MDSVQVYGIEVVLPTLEQWRVAVSSGQLKGTPLASPAVAGSWLDNLGHVRGAVLGAWCPRDRWHAIPLLHLRDNFYPVHFENVICEHCGERCGLSACPDTTLLRRRGAIVAETWELFKQLPVLSCPHCGKKLNRRQTIWFAENVHEAQR